MNVGGEWRSAPGAYMLILELAAPATLAVGRLGQFMFPAGRYVYAGSALGPGGVAGRVSRHLRPDKRIHWHIDALTAVAPVTGVVAAYGAERRECQWARHLQKLKGAEAPAPGFGSTDCRSGCLTHLWLVAPELSLAWIENELAQCPIQAI